MGGIVATVLLVFIGLVVVVIMSVVVAIKVHVYLNRLPFLSLLYHCVTGAYN